MSKKEDTDPVAEVKSSVVKDKAKKGQGAKGEIQDSTINSTTPDLSDSEQKEDKSFFHFVKSVPSRTHCVVKNQEKWHTEGRVEAVESEAPANMSYWLQKLTKYTDKVYENEVNNYEAQQKSRENRSNTAWIQTVLKKGTLTDRLSAYAVQIQSSPVHSLSNMETLLSMVSLKSRRSCLLAIDSLTQLFVADLLIPDKKLKNFEQNPFHALQQLSGGNKDTRDKYLILWMFEHKLKDFYGRFLAALEAVGRDSIENTKIKVISTLQRLLLGNPECEQVLLERLINRLGDPSRTVASKAMHYLTGVLEEFPAMKDVIVREVERLLYRPNINPKAQYYGICFLTQLILDKEDTSNLAGKLIIIYFSFFKNTIKKGEIDTKLMSALLTGVHRAFPYSTLDPAELDEQIETMHKLVHMVSFNVSVQALTLLYQILDSKDSVSDRFYTALYKKAVDPDFATSSKQVMFLNLLYNSMRKDTSTIRVHSFIKRLLQTCEYLPSHCSAGILFIVSEIIRSRKDLGSIWKVMESNQINTDLSRFDYSDDDDDEHYDDVLDEDAGGDDAAKGGEKPDQVKTAALKTQTDARENLPGYIFRKKSSAKENTGYDPMHRNPMFSGADKTAYWELHSLCNHFHPTVSLFAKHLCENQQIKYPGDPLNDFTITKFLERFVFKNPKKDPEGMKRVSVHGKRKLYRPHDVKALAPDSADFVNRAPETIPEDEIFIYNYFQAKAERKGGKDDDNASINSEEIDDFLGRMGDVDFAKGVAEGEEEEKEGADHGDSDDDAESGDEGNVDEDGDMSGDSEPDFDEDDAGFKDLSSGDENDNDDDDVEGGDGDDEDGEMNEEDIEFSNDDEDDDLEPPTAKKAKKRAAATVVKAKKAKKTKFDPTDLQSLLADAEDFSHLLEENDNEGTSASYSTKDKASAKQLKWEQQRENFMKNSKSWKGGKKKERFKGKRKFGKR
eukprot:TRINITY_DN4592_c1_g1_i3.p1 TRINITY_DN4592_c1_g1~~TRINITY_DN4592_c1_g1_i3.p1  ORF type:complete len:956 (-),score=346.92 TRINITY_DN4592_c1_g1_i3:44-2911(-)